MTTITEAQFIEQFRPECNPDGSYYLQRDWTVRHDLEMINTAREANRLWTFVNDGAGNGGIVQGFSVVNREFYIIASVPHGTKEYFDVLTELDFCTICGERFADTLDDADEDVVPRSRDDDARCVQCIL